ncbi:hypothetical protein, partial [Paraburkholderia tropica]|uniref:hypothetical protein n=1 Tax=Paraburkholderia tropica TaxID=92647 RepID=UPI001C64B836
MAADKPLLDKPVKGWRSDLGGPNEAPKGQLFAIGEPPNHVDDTYLEVHFATLWGRGVLMWLGLPQILLTVWLMPIWIDIGGVALLIAAGFIASCIWMNVLEAVAKLNFRSVNFSELVLTSCLVLPDRTRCL